MLGLREVVATNERGLFPLPSPPTKLMLEVKKALERDTDTTPTVMDMSLMHENFEIYLHAISSLLLNSGTAVTVW